MKKTNEHCHKCGQQMNTWDVKALVEANCPYLKVGNRAPNPIIYTQRNGQMAFA